MSQRAKLHIRFILQCSRKVLSVGAGVIPARRSEVTKIKAGCGNHEFVLNYILRSVDTIKLHNYCVNICPSCVARRTRYFIGVWKLIVFKPYGKVPFLIIVDIFENTTCQSKLTSSIFNYKARIILSDSIQRYPVSIYLKVVVGADLLP